MNSAELRLSVPQGSQHRQGKSKITPQKITLVMGHKMLDSSSNSQLQNMVIRDIRQIRSPTEVNPLPARGGTKIIEQDFPLLPRHGNSLPEALAANQFLVFQIKSCPHKSLILLSKATIQNHGACPLFGLQR